MTSWSSVGGLGRSRGLCWRSCATLGAYVGGLGPLLGPLWAVLGCSWGLRGRSWPLSGPLLAVLCRSWGLCWRSWAALGTFVGGPGPSWAEKWPKPEREGDQVRDQGPLAFSARRRLSAAGHVRDGTAQKSSVSLLKSRCSKLSKTYSKLPKCVPSISHALRLHRGRHLRESEQLLTQPLYLC